MSDADLKLKQMGEADRPNNEGITPEQEEAFKKQRDSQTRLDRAKDAFTSASESRKRYDWEWLSRDLFRRGYQFSRYNPTSKTVILASKQNTKIPVNLTGAAMRVIRNQVTAFRPKWEVLPKSGSGEQGQKDARFGGKLLDAVWKMERLKKKTKETVTQGLMYSVGGAWQLGWDDKFKNADGSTGKVTIWLIDPFDFYMDPNTTDGLAFTDAEFVIKAVRTSLSAIQSNPLYRDNGAEDVPAESRVAASEYKQFLLQSLKNMGNYQSEENETAILKEGYFKERDENGRVTIRVLHWVDSSLVPLFEKVLNTDDFDFRMYQADINPLEVYGEGWAKHVIPVNRVINALESSIFDYNYKFAKGRLVIDKNSGVRSVTNEHGSIIEKNQGASVTTLPLQPLPSSLESQAQRFRSYFEDISGAHDASLGRIPTGVKSGIGISELKQADATNQDDLVDNLEDFLVEVGQKALNILAKNLDTPRVFEIPGQNGQYERFAVIGEKFAKGRKKKEIKVGTETYPLVILSEKNKVDVQIGSWLAYSKQARQEELKNLFSMGVIDQKTLLEHLEFGDVDTIVDRTRTATLLKGAQQQPGGTNPQVPEEQLALEENKMLLEGNSNVHAQPQDNHNVHLVVHQEALGKGKDELLKAHMQEHMALMGGGGTVSGADPAAQNAPMQFPEEGTPQPDKQLAAIQ